MHDLDEDIVQKTVQVKKQFHFGQIMCSYTNIQIMNRNIPCHQSSKIKIHNNLCQNINDHLTKKTQIIIQDKTIIIEDHYQFTKNDEKSQKNNQNTVYSDGNSVKDSQNKGEIKKKKLIFKKKGWQQFKCNQKRNTKNVTKNFCKAFIAYLGQQQMTKMHQKMKILGKNYNFSNKIIIQISQDSQLKHLFKYFLLNKANQWIESSRISDKDTHIQAIQLYLKIIQKNTKEFESSQNQQVFYSDNQDENQEQQ